MTCPQITHPPLDARSLSTPSIVTLPEPATVEATLYARGLEAELDQLSGQLMQTYEELNLIHDLACNLEDIGDRAMHCRKTLEKLAVCLPTATMAILLAPESEELPDCGADGCEGVHRGFQIVQTGRELDDELLYRISDELGDDEAVVINYPLRSAPQFDRVVSVRLGSSTRCAGRLLAIGERESPELGTVEVQLMQSVASILQAHLAIDQQFAEMREMFAGTVLALVSAVDAKDPYTCGHSSRVSHLAQLLATDLGLDATTIETVRMAGLLHDIGKIGVPDAILGKPDKLTEEEFAEMKKHPELGYRILRGIRQFASILPGVRHHHESWDGTGYPAGLAGEEIPRIARILAVADAFDAMSSDRPYRAGMPLDVVEDKFRQGRGQQWDAEVVDCLLSSHSRLERLIENRDSRGGVPPIVASLAAP